MASEPTTNQTYHCICEAGDGEGHLPVCVLSNQRTSAERAPDADATTPEPLMCGDCGAPMDPGEARVFTCCEACWDRHYRALGVRKDAAEPRDQRAAADDAALLRRMVEVVRSNTHRSGEDHVGHVTLTTSEVERLEGIAARLASLDAERDTLLRFAGNALTDVRLREIGDWDGGAIQDALTECGLIERQERVVPCGEGCCCIEYYDTGETAECYPITPLGQTAVAAYRAWEDARSVSPTEDTAND